MKLFKEICQFVVVCYVSCLLTKIIINGFTFNVDYLIDSLFITFDAAAGWFTCRYFLNKKNNGEDK